MAVVYIGGHVSGAHYNPAVTLTLLILRKIGLVKSLLYMVCQFGGGFFAALLFNILKGTCFSPAPMAQIVLWKPMLVECLLTFILCAVIVTVAATEKFKKSFIYGAVIGLTLTTLAFIGGSYSGGAVNPAVAMGPMFVDFLKGGTSFLQYPIYLVGPFAGGALAALFCKFMND